jgi:hypothetical protein
MRNTNIEQTLFLTLVRSTRERSCAHLLIDSIRSFGGALSSCPIWLFEANSQGAPFNNRGGKDVQIFPLSVPGTVKDYYFADKVYACAKAEEGRGDGQPKCSVIDLDRPRVPDHQAAIVVRSGPFV